MQNLEQIKDTIKKMFNLAADNAAYDGEIANAINMARAMMEKYNISEEEIVNKKEEELKFTRSRYYTKVTTVSLWESRLAALIQKMVGVCVYTENKVIPRNDIGMITSNGEKGCITWYGLPEDVNFAKEIYHETYQIIATMAICKWGGAFRGNGRSYCEGFVKSLGDKYYASKQTTSSSRALVVVTKKQQLAKQWLEREHGIRTIKLKRQEGTYYHDAYSDGRSDGQSFSFREKSKKNGGFQHRLT